MVLAERMELDVAQQHNFIVSFVKNSLEMRRGFSFKPAMSSALSACDAIRSFEQALAIGVFADRE